MTLFKKYLVALFVVFLHFASQIKYLTSLSNRYDSLWRRVDGWALVADIFGIALAAAALAWGLERVAARLKRPWLKRVLDHLFLVAVLSGLLAAAPCIVALDIRSFLDELSRRSLAQLLRTRRNAAAHPGQ